MEDETEKKYSISDAALQHAREAEPRDLEFVSENTKIIDIGYDSENMKTAYPDWYKKPQRPEIENNIIIDPFEQMIFLDGFRFHIKGENTDSYERVAVARLAYCLNEKGKPVLSVASGDDKAFIPLSDSSKNRKLVADLSVSKKEAGYALLANENLQANEIVKKSINSIAANKEVSKIKKDLAKGLSLFSIGLKAAGEKYR